MVSEWPFVSLGDHVELQTGFPFRSSQYSADPTDTRLLRGDNIVQGRLRWDGVKRWPNALASQFPQFQLRAGDVVLAMDRPWIDAGLKYAVISDHDLPALLVQRVTRFRGTDSLDGRYLRYLIGSRTFTEYVLAVQTGTAVPHISSTQIRGFRFRLPPVSEQRSISNVLGALDAKIELNMRINSTLEALAHVIFKSWFADFDPVHAKAEGRQPLGLDAETTVLFSDSFQDAPLGKIPKGWKPGHVGELAELSRKTVNPGNAPDEIFDHYSLPAFDESQWPAEEPGLQIKSNKTVVPTDAVLLSKLNPRIPRIWLPQVNRSRRSVASTEFLVATSKPGVSREYLFCLFSSNAFLDVFESLVTGTSGSHQRVKPEFLLAMQTVIPPFPLIGSFTRLVAPFLTQYVANLAESRTLASLRDALLPKLISGDIRIGQAGKLTEVST